MAVSRAPRKARAVGRLQGCWPAGDGAKVAQVGHQVAGGQHRTDVLLGEGFALGAKHHRALFDGAGGEGDVGGDDDIVGLDLFHDPVIRCVGAFGHELETDGGVVRRAHPRVGHQGDGEAVAASHTVDLRLHRAGIGIDKDVEQRG